MSSVGYLFGNVDDKGKLQDSSLPEDLRHTIEENEDYLSRILGDFSFGSDGATNADGRDAAGIVKPDENAVDFSGIDELAEDKSTVPFPSYLPPMVIPRAPSLVIPTSSLPRAGSDEDYDTEEEEPDNRKSAMPGSHTFRTSVAHPHAISASKTQLHPARVPSLQQPPIPAKPVIDRERLAMLFEGFGEGELRFTEIFSPKVDTVGRPKRKPLTGVHRKRAHFALRDDRELFKQKLPPPRPKPPRLVFPDKANLQPSQAQRKAKEEAISKEIATEIETPAELFPIVLDHWEDHILWDEPDSEPESPPIPKAKTSAPAERASETKPAVVTSHLNERLVFRNYSLDTEDWEARIEWEGDRPPPDTALGPSIAQKVRVYRNPMSDVYLKQLKRFNLSHDRFYDSQSHQSSDRVRQTYGGGVLQHALPAIKLHPHYYKPHLSKKDLRSFHRPAFRVIPNNVIRFSRVRSSKKKKQKGKDTNEIMKTPRDITLKDTTRYVMMEYSEEYPPMIMNPGMGSLVYNYYRKFEEKDTHIPTLEIGNPFLLEDVDASPFFGFGEVEPGQTLQALSNNMFRAPIFKQDPAPSDFLLIRHTFKNETKYYLREIPHLYVVGQTFPVQEVPRPQSRRITQTTKGRLQVVTFRHMRRDPQKRLRYDHLVKSFPGFAELQLRQRLKEFAQFAKKGENTGWWKLKPNVALPNEEEIRRIVTPEMVCLVESMQTGQQRLRDIGYSDIGADDDNDEEEINADIEVQLAPWTLTKNFVQASQNKSMIKLYGPGDPTGRGEAFSFIRASMKEPFLRQGESAEDRLEREKTKPKSYHRFSFAEQQQVYREEIKRIWEAQLSSLSMRERPEDDDQMDFDALDTEKERNEVFEERERQREYGYVAANRALSPPAMGSNRSVFSDGDHDDTTSIAESGTSYGQAGRTKRLTIRRVFRKPSGEEEIKSEVVTDMRVINAYLRQRALIEHEEAASMEMYNETGVDDVQRRKRRRVQEHVNRMKENRKGKNHRDGDSDDEPEKPHEPLTLKIRAPSGQNVYNTPHSGNIPATPTPSSLSKRRQSSISITDADYLTPFQPKSYGRRRAAPEVDLNSIFEKIVSDLIAIPEAYEFCRPVSAVAVPDYYNIIKRPKTLEQIRDGARAYHFKTDKAFLDDLQLVAYNCRIYNGPLHPLTHIAENLVTQAAQQIEMRREEVNRLVQELADAEANANTPISQTQAHHQSLPPRFPQQPSQQLPPPPPQPLPFQQQQQSQPFNPMQIDGNYNPFFQDPNTASYTLPYNPNAHVGGFHPANGVSQAPPPTHDPFPPPPPPDSYPAPPPF
ncbi:hypothetical protein DFS34DRAFT_633941 [Phlyctochytrium arcticum]|nr:hypothetical protein DFS34DRAFT_633941 [Phlyctochytrium arcticum]